METAYRVSPLEDTDPEQLGIYTLLGRLGSGGMGVVYLGRAPDGPYVAVKTIHAAPTRDAEFRGRFRSEVARLGQVPPFCTAELLDADLEHDPPYLVVEYVDGPSLAEIVTERGALRAANLQSLAVGVATALTGIHGAGIVHRDLKPDNILMPPGNPKVIDFGIARAVDTASRHTAPHHTVGTIAYMAPERIDGSSGAPVTPAADVFAWGCVVAFAATGRSPFHGDSGPATAARILSQPPELSGLEEPLHAIVEAALAKEPHLRPTARELLDLLLDGPAPTSDARPPTASPPRRWLRHRRRIVAGLGAAALLAGAAGVAAAYAPDASHSRPATGTTEIIRDALRHPGTWRNTETPRQNATCTVQQVLTVTRTDRKSYMCTGSETIVSNAISIEVKATLRTKGACASIWFYWNPGRGGDVLRICQSEIALGVKTAEGTTVIGSLPAAQRILAGWTAHLRFEVAQGVVKVYRGGDLAGELKLPAGSPTTGKIRLGIEVEPQGGRAPFSVAFSELEVRSL